MFAVIKTGGKQYRVSPGDLVVVEKLDGAPGDELRFDQVLMMGEGEQITVGAPLVEGGLVRAVLVETRKGEKVKVFKKKRRQGYRRTGGHRQHESVLRVMGLEGAGQSATWDGQVDLTPRSVLVARSRGLAAPTMETPEQGVSRGTVAGVAAESHVVVTDVDGPPVIQATVVEHAGPDVLEATSAPKKARAKKAAAPADETGALVEPPTSEVAEDAPQTVETATDETGAQAGTETKKPRARKAKPASDGGEA